MKKIIAVTILFIFSLPVFAQEKLITNGLKISRTTSIKSKLYKIDGYKNLDKSVILIEGNNITIDFRNAVLKGSNTKKNPDEFFGIAVLIQNSKNVTIKNLRVKGYKIAVYAKNTEGLVLDNCDLSYNYREHLNSTPEKEDVSDWMSYHQNEKDEWLRYGAAIYLRNCNKAVIKTCKVTGGQNALMLMECNGAMIYNNDFSFNSGIGIGLYKCSGNSILYNRLIFNVRGYSYMVYNRGQDSAGILVYEQSNNNLFYKNNVTHCGDGFFLWAGQTTMDNGQGGCNDNIIAENDFSYAPTNGVEVTFSRNTITDNRIFECDNGIWAGYSYQSAITNNKFRNNNRAIAIEHGQQNRIAFNIFYGDKQAIQLWGSADTMNDPIAIGWGYTKYRNTKSQNYIIASNNFNNNETVFNLGQTDSLNIFNNIYAGYETLFKTDSTVTNMDTTLVDELAVELSTDKDLAVPVVDRPANPFKNAGAFTGKKNIRVTEWGPYDFRSPIIWNAAPADTSGVLHLDILGPKGAWKIKTARGVQNISASSGEFPATITAEIIKGERTDILIELEYKGLSIITPDGLVLAKGKPYTFSFKKFFQPIQWTVNFFNLDTASFNPVKENQLFAPNVRVRPVKTDTVTNLDYTWWSGLKTADTAFAQFISVAEGSANFTKGNYELSATWDDAIRVFVDNKLVLEDWNPALHKFDESPNRRIVLPLNGTHAFRVEHLNLGGLGVLALKLKPAE